MMLRHIYCASSGLSYIAVRIVASCRGRHFFRRPFLKSQQNMRGGQTTTSPQIPRTITACLRTVDTHLKFLKKSIFEPKYLIDCTLAMTALVVAGGASALETMMGCSIFLLIARVRLASDRSRQQYTYKLNLNSLQALIDGERVVLTDKNQQQFFVLVPDCQVSKNERS